jgi:hypothetical protein
MGTSGAFGGSGGKDAKDLRDSIVDWLIDTPAEPSGSSPVDGDNSTPGNPDSDAPSGASARPQSSFDLRPAIRILTSRGSGGAGSSGGGGSARSSGSGGGGRSSGGAHRSLGKTSRATGRAGVLARAYVAGDRASLQRLGLDYDELLALGDMVAVGTKIVQAAFDTQADSTIEDDESREIVAQIVEWILESPADRPPSPDEIVRRSIEVIIAGVTLTEVGDRIRKESSREKRAAAEQEIRDAAEVYASQLTLSNTGASEQEMSAAIDGGIRELGRIFGGRK